MHGCQCLQETVVSDVAEDEEGAAAKKRRTDACRLMPPPPRPPRLVERTITVSLGHPVGDIQVITPMPCTTSSS